jgi:hypothetical protein
MSRVSQGKTSFCKSSDGIFIFTYEQALAKFVLNSRDDVYFLKFSINSCFGMRFLESYTPILLKECLIMDSSMPSIRGNEEERSFMFENSNLELFFSIDILLFFSAIVGT